MPIEWIDVKIYEQSRPQQVATCIRIFEREMDIIYSTVLCLYRQVSDSNIKHYTQTLFSF